MTRMNDTGKWMNLINSSSECDGNLRLGYFNFLSVMALVTDKSLKTNIEDPG